MSCRIQLTHSHSHGLLGPWQASGALNGLTRVRRFQQDDGHIFCRPDQIKSEVIGAMDFLKYTYSLFGFNMTVAGCYSYSPDFRLRRSTEYCGVIAKKREALHVSGHLWLLPTIPRNSLQRVSGHYLL